MSRADPIIIEYLRELGIESVDEPITYPLVFKYGDLGRLFFDQAENLLLVYLESDDTIVRQELREKALRLCGFEMRRNPPVRACLGRNNHLVFATRFQDSDVNRSKLRETIDLLTALQSEIVT